MASGSPHIADKGLRLITIGLDQGAAESAQRVAAEESIQHFTAFPEYVEAHAIGGVAGQADGSEAIVCLVNFDKNKELAAKSAVAVQAACGGRATLVALSAEENPALILMAMRAGCTEYLRQPLQTDGLASCLQRLWARCRATSAANASGAGRMIGFLGVRGGAGATTIAVHLGTFLAQRHSQKTLLLDRHPHLGHVAMLLGLETQGYDFPEMVDNLARMDLALLNSYVACHSSGLHVLRSPESLSRRSAMCGEALERAIRFLGGIYDFILVDCPQGMDECNQVVVRRCDEFYFVTTPELPAVRDLSRYLACAAELEIPPAKLKVILNQQDSRRVVTAEQVEEAIQHPVNLTLPFCPSDLVPAVDAGEPVPCSKKSPFAIQIRKWACTLAPAPEAATHTRRRFAFWS